MPSHDKKSNPFPLQALISSICFLVYAILTISIHMRKRQIEREEDDTRSQTKGTISSGRIPKSLESLLLNFVVIFIIFVSYLFHILLDW